MKPSIKRLRDAYNEYLNAYQARYDELMAEFGAHSLDPAGTEAMEVHQMVTTRMDYEKNSVEGVLMEDGTLMVSVTSYIKGDVIVVPSTGQEFDIS